MVTRVYGRIKQSASSVFQGENLKAKVFRGGAWLGGASFAEQMARFARNMILTRVLAPEAFGMMAIVMSAGSLIDTFTDIGIKDAIIQNPRGGEDRYLNAGWWMVVARGIVIYSLIFSLAPWLARFYGNPELAPLIRVALLSVLFYSFMSAGAYLGLKQMKFGKWATLYHGGGIFGVVTTVILSFYIPNVWALVIGYCAEAAGRCLLSYLLCPYLPRFRWNNDAGRDLFKFSRGLFGLSLLNLIFARADIFVLAKLYSAAELGLYSMAVYLIQTPIGFLMGLLGQTLLPTLSQIQGDEGRVNRIFLQVTSLLVMLGMPAFVFVFFCGRSVLTLMYGHPYSAAAAPLIAASAVALFNTLNGQITSVFYARGLPQLHRTCVLIMAIAMIALIYPFAKWFGFVGAQLACLVSVLLGFLFQMARLRALTRFDLSQFGKPLLLSGVISVSAVAVCLCARPFSIFASPVPNILIGTLGCLVAYGLGGALFFRSEKGTA